MKRALLIYGPGAIGRGYLPWVFPPGKFKYFYVARNKKLQNLLNTRKKFTTLKTVKGRYEKLIVPIEHCFLLNEEKKILSDIDAIFTAVGPRNIIAIAGNLRGTKTPIVCFENDSSSPQTISMLTGNPNTAFAIPDVITSNTAPTNLKRRDPLSLITEDGICFIDKKVRFLGGNATYVSTKELKKQWIAKLYLHNTPHCITAYLGSFVSANYIHEVMKNQKAKKIVGGAMREMEKVIIKKFRINSKFANWYANKELKRFENDLLFDPVSRVAREPFRKLAPDERLIGAAEICLSAGVIPKNLLVGIMAAFYYDNPKDMDAHIRYLVKSLTPENFLKIVMQISKGDALHELLLENWRYNLKLLYNLK